MHVDVYTFENVFRFSFKDESNQRNIGLDKMMPDPRFKQLSFDEGTGRLDFSLGSEGTVLSNTKNDLKLGNEMRATATGATLGIQVVHDQPKVRVPLIRTAPGRFRLFLPRNFYNVRSDNLFALTGV